MPKKYKVTIEETLTYHIEVEAENENDARELAFNSYEFTNNLSDDNDAAITDIEELED